MKKKCEHKKIVKVVWNEILQTGKHFVKCEINRRHSKFRNALQINRLVGCIMYVMSTTRLDLSVALNYYSIRFQNEENEIYWKEAKRNTPVYKTNFTFWAAIHKYLKCECICGCRLGGSYGQKVYIKWLSRGNFRLYCVSCVTRKQATVALYWILDLSYIRSVVAKANSLWHEYWL